MMNLILCVALSGFLMNYSNGEVEVSAAEEIKTVEILNKIKESGTYVRFLGNLSMNAGKYYVVLALEPHKFQLEFDDVISKISAFNQSYEEDVNKKLWSDTQNLSDLKRLIKNKVIMTVKSLKSKVNSLNEKYLDMASAYQAPNLIESKYKRGLFNFVGSAFSFLFGTAQSTDVNAVKKDIMVTKKGVLDILHSNEKLMSMFSLKNNQISDIEFEQSILLNATKRLTSSLSAQALAYKELKRQALFNHMMSELEHFRTKVLLVLNNLDLHISNYFSYLQDAELGKLNPAIVRPNLMNSILQSISSKLPAYLSLPIEFKPSNLYEFYSIIKTDLVSITDKNQAIILEIPLINNDRIFTVVMPTILNMPLVENINATSKLALKSNEVYILETGGTSGFTTKFLSLKKECQLWKSHYLCEESLFSEIPNSDILCLKKLINKYTNDLIGCEKQIYPNFQLSQISYLSFNEFAFSIRGETKLEIIFTNVRAKGENVTRILTGVGTFKIPESCFMVIEGKRYFSKFHKIDFYNTTLKPDLILNKITPGFLATNLQWQDMKNTTFDIDIPGLKKLEKSLLREISFQTKRSLLNQKTKSLLDHTQNLIKLNEKALLNQMFTFDTPDNHSIFLYVLIICCLTFTIGAYIHVRILIRNQNLKYLTAIHRAYFPDHN